MGRQKRQGGSQPVHYSSHVVIANVDNSTASASVLLVFDKKRYLFNAGEGIQRHLTERKLKVSKITSVLATRVSTDTLAGLPGMLLSQVVPGSDAQGDDALKAVAFGPQGMARYSSAFRQYAGSFKLELTEIGASHQGAVVDDGCVKITPLPLAPAADGDPAAAGAAPAAGAGVAAGAPAGSTDAAAEPGEPAPKKQRTGAAAPPAAEGSPGPGLGRGVSPLAPLAVGYLCQLATVPGKFDPQKAAQLGVPRGPLYGELQRGNAVTAANGRVVQPHEVMATPEVPGASLAVVDCPSGAYLQSLRACAQLNALTQQHDQQQQQQQPTKQPGAAANGDAAAAAAAAPGRRLVFVHLGPSAVTGSEPYREWMGGFGPGALHLVASGDAQLSPTTLRAAVLQAQLNAIEPQVFPLQGFAEMGQRRQQQQQEQQEQQPGDGGSGGGVVVASSGLRYTLAPLKHQGMTAEAATAALDLEAQREAVRGREGRLAQLLSEYEAAKAEVQAQGTPPELAKFGRRSCEVTLLGTCSACPSNHRNVSAYYVDLFDRGGLLADCGEDTMGQLARRYGRADAERRIRELAAVWISHMHADHHGGLYPLMLERAHLQAAAATAAGQGQGQGQGGEPAPLLVLGPWPLFRVLCDYAKALPLAFSFVPNTYFYSPGPRPPPAAALKAYEAAKEALGLERLEPFAVQHVSHSTGLRLEGRDGWKLVFSGDTRPCQAVIDAARGATLLVHEATFEDELQGEAVAKKHSTTAEALGVAAAAGAYRTVLTHFSMRYPKIPVMRPPGGGAGEEGNEAGGGGGGTDLAAVGNVVVGFDLMSVNLADLAWLPKMLPALDELFKEEEQSYQQDDAAEEEA